MDTNLELYKIFRKVAENNSFSAAAKSLFISQPAVSQSIKLLEKSLGTTLFIRLPKGVMLTNEGKDLFEYINSAINLIEMGETRLLKSKSLEFGELTIGAGDTITKEFLLKYINIFHGLYPDITIKVINRTSPELVDFLKQGIIDLAVVNLPIKEERINIIACMEIQDIFVAGKKYDHIMDKTLTYKEISKYPLIMLEKKANSRRYIDTFFSSKGTILKPEIELGAYDLLIDFAKIGLGIASVIKEFSQPYLDDNSLFPIKLEKPIPKRNIGIAFLKEIHLSAASEKFVELIRNNS